MTGAEEVFFAKALESLAGAESEFANERYNNCANRCYYACFQAAIAALLSKGISVENQKQTIRHTYVQSQFVEQLIRRKKVYESGLKDTLARTLMLRQIADYEIEQLSQAQAYRSLTKTRTFINAIVKKGKSIS